MSTAVSEASASTMSQVLSQQASLRPQRRAFLVLDRGEREAASVTYAELDIRARSIARALGEHGLEGQRVILAYPTCCEFVAALFGCFYAGVIAIPTPVAARGHAAVRMQAILKDADPAAVLSVRSALGVEGTQNDFAVPRNRGLLRLPTDEIDCPSEGVLSAPADQGRIAMLQYTSGSTEEPRGVLLTHANILHNQRVISAALGSGCDDVVVGWLPLYHDMGLIGSVLHTVFIGGTCVLMPPLAFLQRPTRWLQAISKYRATISLAPSFAFGLCATRGVAGGVNIDLSSWRVAICGGETVRPRMLERFSKAFLTSGFNPKAFMPSYGLAEATLMVSAPPAGSGLVIRDLPRQGSEGSNRIACALRQLACCGQPRHGTQIAIVDPTSGRAVAHGSVGEIWLRGPSIAAGYWNRPAHTGSTFRAALGGSGDDMPWLRTGDLGFLCADGLVVSGRIKEVIVVRGANFDPLDLENVAGESHPALVPGGGGAFAVEQEDGEAVVIVHEVERSAMRTVDTSRVAGNVIEAISRNFGLTLFDLALLRPGTLPRTTSGKIQRYRCKEQYLAHEIASLHMSEQATLGRYRPHPPVA